MKTIEFSEEKTTQKDYANIKWLTKKDYPNITEENQTYVLTHTDSGST